MSLNTIFLSNKTVADLYKNSLVETSEKKPADEIYRAEISFKFLGENRKHVLIVVNYADAVHIPDMQLGFLTNMLSACKLTLADTAVFNFQKYSSKDFNNIISFFKPKTVFLFGTEPAGFGMPLLFPPFQIQTHNNATFIFTPSVQEIEKDKTLKNQLWNCLKKIFGL